MTELIPALGALVLEQLADRRFVVATGIPAWCREVRPHVRWDAPLVIEEVFPFLSVFLPDAERAWSSDRPLRVDSDLWAERDARSGEDVHFMASAVRVDASRALLIQRNEALFDQKQGLLQRARELQMTHSSLMREIEQKDILVHAIVHDLAAPLHSIIGVLSLLDERTQRDPETGWIAIGLLAANRQQRLIGEILDVFAAESGASGRPTEAVVLSDVLDRVVAEREPVARTRSLVLRIDGAVPRSARVVADETRLFRVLTNIIDNAFRFSPPGGVVALSTRLSDDAATLTVDDDGPGVRPEVLPRLFEKCARARDDATGTGLGLFFCRISVENWGGGIGYEQREAGGARFWIRLKLAQSAASFDAGRERRGDHGEGPDARR